MVQRCYRANRHIRISLRRRGWGICCLVLILAGVSIANQRQQVKALIWYFIAGAAPLPLTLIRRRRRDDAGDYTDAADKPCPLRYASANRHAGMVAQRLFLITGRPQSRTPWGLSNPRRDPVIPSERRGH
ncbi:MAG: hypothetical protein R2867_05095 [Caldilineaceae bacterium]